MRKTMDDLVVIDIPVEGPAVEHGHGDKIDDDVMVLGVPSPGVYEEDQDMKKGAKLEVLLDPEPRMCELDPPSWLFYVSSVYPYMNLQH
jgi:hypothetical protein